MTTSASETIDVVLFRNGARWDGAEADGPENAVYAGRTLHDEARAAAAPVKPRLEVGFYVDGKLSRLVQGRP